MLQIHEILLYPPKDSQRNPLLFILPFTIYISICAVFSVPASLFLQGLFWILTSSRYRIAMTPPALCQPPRQ